MNIITIFDGKTFAYKKDTIYSNISYVRSIMALELTKIEVPNDELITVGDFVMFSLNEISIIGTIQVIEKQKEVQSLNIAFGSDMYTSDIYFKDENTKLQSYSFDNYNDKYGFKIEVNDATVNISKNIITADTLFRQILRQNIYEEKFDIKNRKLTLINREREIPKIQLEDGRILEYNLELISDKFNCLELIYEDSQAKKLWGITTNNEIVELPHDNLKKPEKRKCFIVDNLEDFSSEKAIEELSNQTYENHLSITIDNKFLESLDLNFITALGSRINVYKDGQNLETIITSLEFQNNVITLFCGLSEINLTDKWRD